MAVFPRVVRVVLMTTVLALGLGGTASAQVYVNPHLSEIPEDSLINYQVRVQDMLTTQAMAGNQNPDLNWITAAMHMDDVDAPPSFRLHSELERIMSTGPDAVESELGIDPEGWVSIYHQGLVAVVRVDLNSADQLLAWLDDEGVSLNALAAQSSDDHTLYTLSDQPIPEIQGYLWVDADTARLVVAPAGMSPAALVRRLSTASPSLADTDSVGQMNDRYGFTGSELFWLDSAGLTGALLSQEGHALSEDLMKFVPDYRAMLSDPVMNVCAAEIVSLAEVTPRFLYGATGLSVDHDTLSAAFHGSMEVADETLLQELAELEGRLPQYLTEPADSLFTFGLAINAVQLGDTLMAWRDRVVQADWECPGLVDFQAEMAEINMASVMAASGLLQGARGVVIEIFDMDLRVDNMNAVQGLLAIQADNPQRLARMLAESLSPSADFQVPGEGEVSSFELPDALVQVRISGDYLMVYNGPQAEARAVSLADAEHVNALMATGIDLPRTLRRLEELPEGMQAQPATGGMSFGGSCEANLFLTDQFSQYDQFFVGGRLATDAFGLGLVQDLSVQRGDETLDSVVRPGTYQLEYFEDCEWFDIGEDRLGPDGQVEYTQSNGTCSVYEERFEWWVEDGALVWGERDGRYRDYCDESFSPWESMEDSVRCQIVRTEGDGSFQCVTQDEYPMRYRYRPVN